MSSPQIVYLGGLEPSQTTVSNPGDYAIVVNLLATNPELTFNGPGNFTLTSVVSALSTMTLAATNGANLTVNGLAGVGSTSNLVVQGDSSITLTPAIGADNPINAQFSGAGGTLTFDQGVLNLLTTAPTVIGFGADDHIDFGVPVANTDIISYVQNVPNTGGTLTLETSTGAPLGTVDLVGQYDLGSFALGKEGIDFACFLRGTRILTLHGYVPVETLREGDLVMTLAERPVPIRSIRRRGFTGAQLGDEAVRPVRIAADAFAEGQPRVDLYVSPDHSMYLDGVFVPARLLLNGHSITQPPRQAPIEYFHVEVEPHNILIAEGAASESYLDIGNQGHFGRPGSIVLLPSTEPLTWEDACAPLLLGGPALLRLQARLRERALVELAAPALLMSA